MVFGQYTASEQEQILTELFPDLRTVLQKLIVVLMESKTSSRPYSIRDLIFWCQRCVRHQKAAANGLDRDILFLEGLHVFCNHLSNLNEKWRIASQIGHAFQITDEKITHYLEEWTPSFIRTSRKLTVNNISYDVPDVEGDSGGENSGFPFCITKQTARLLEFLTSSILLKQPVLMVGETGVGKTTTVQYMGNIFRKKVHVINMCEQTESADLFGGFKPVDIGFALRPLVEEFQEMCSKCFSEKKNKAFFGEIFNMLHNKQWTHLLALIIKVAVLGRDKKNASPKTIQVWSAMIGKFKKIETNLKAKATNMFAYVNGILAKAMQAGDWVLLDEINMAEAEMLHSLTSVLTNSE